MPSKCHVSTTFKEIKRKSKEKEIKAAHENEIFYCFHFKRKLTVFSFNCTELLQLHSNNFCFRLRRINVVQSKKNWHFLCVPSSWKKKFAPKIHKHIEQNSISFITFNVSRCSFSIVKHSLGVFEQFFFLILFVFVKRKLE